MNGKKMIIGFLALSSISSAFADVDCRTPLMKAIGDNNLNKVQRLLNRGANPNEGRYFSTSSGNCEYSEGAIFGSLTEPLIIEALIKAGAEVNALRQGWQTPLAECATAENVECVKILLSNHADPNLVDRDGVAPLRYTLLNANPYLDNAVANSTEIYGLLVSNGAQVDFETLSLAASVSSSTSNSIAEAVAKGLDLSKPNSDGMPFLSYFFDKNPNGFWAGSSPNKSPMEFLDLLVTAGADVNAKDPDGRTPIMYVKSDDVDDYYTDISRLTSKGALINATDNQKMTPLMWAYKNNDDAEAVFFKEFLDAGANVNAQDITGKTPLMYAVSTPQFGWSDRRPSKEYVAQLLQAGANINMTDFSGKTALMYSVLKRDVGNDPDMDFAFTEALLENGADINIQDKDGHTALFYAKQSGADSLFPTGAK